MIQNNEKFALLSFFDSNANLASDVTIVENELYVTPKCPIQITNYWKELVGKIQNEKIENSNLYILSKQKVENPEINGIDNIRCRDRSYMFYCALVIINELLCEYYPLEITGAKIDDSMEVQGFAQLQMPVFVNHTPFLRIDNTLIDEAMQIYFGLSELSLAGKHGRIFRGINFFLNGLTSLELSDRLHNFTRVIEAFISPNTGDTTKQFRSRTELFIGPCFHDLMGKIYKVRSNIEHVHEYANDIPSLMEKEYIGLIIKTQYLARNLLSIFLKEKDMWSHFEDANINNFWQLNASDRKEIWRTDINMLKFSKEIDQSLG